ncbi:MAG: hypothetical protein HC840_18015 [Leptolyngbyaceae cyanobacterium RM2_2_4]|nr:hypothetical protein [Leptolyngbyaceae cyanobacterium SM1_4_3]NJO51025.1 hypothetical protein [Leptolyngbyaceae cyanobacterium RM2_2_4]
MHKSSLLHFIYRRAIGFSRQGLGAIDRFVEDGNGGRSDVGEDGGVKGAIATGSGRAIKWYTWRESS